MQAETNYIYIVFAVLYVIYSIVKAVKKNAEQKQVVKKPEQKSTVQPPTASPVSKPGDDFKKMLEDLLGGTQEVEVPEKQIQIPKPQPVTVRPRPAKIAPHHPKKEKLASQYAKPLTPKKSVPAESTPVFKQHPEIVQKVFADTAVEAEQGVDFDIRQAIIYSEILKRPQY